MQRIEALNIALDNCIGCINEVVSDTYLENNSDEHIGDIYNSLVFDIHRLAYEINLIKPTVKLVQVEESKYAIEKQTVCKLYTWKIDKIE